MKYYKFHAVMPEDRQSKSASKRYPFQPWTKAQMKEYVSHGKFVDVVAVCTDDATKSVRNNGVFFEGVAGVYEQENSPCCGTSVSWEFLRRRTVRIDEATARKLHPALFEYLDGMGA